MQGKSLEDLENAQQETPTRGGVYAELAAELGVQYGQTHPTSPDGDDVTPAAEGSKDMGSLSQLQYKVVKSVAVTTTPELGRAQDVVGNLDPGTVITAQEQHTKDGVRRLRTSHGWVSEISPRGEVLLQMVPPATISAASPPLNRNHDRQLYKDLKPSNDMELTLSPFNGASQPQDEDSDSDIRSVSDISDNESEEHDEIWESLAWRSSRATTGDGESRAEETDARNTTEAAQGHVQIVGNEEVSGSTRDNECLSKTAYDRALATPRRGNRARHTKAHSPLSPKFHRDRGLARETELAEMVRRKQLEQDELARISKAPSPVKPSNRPHRPGFVPKQAYAEGGASGRFNVKEWSDRREKRQEQTRQRKQSGTKAEQECRFRPEISTVSARRRIGWGDGDDAFHERIQALPEQQAQTLAAKQKAAEDEEKKRNQLQLNTRKKPKAKQTGVHFSRRAPENDSRGLLNEAGASNMQALTPLQSQAATTLKPWEKTQPSPVGRKQPVLHASCTVVDTRGSSPQHSDRSQPAPTRLTRSSEKLLQSWHPSLQEPKGDIYSSLHNLHPQPARKHKHLVGAGADECSSNVTCRRSETKMSTTHDLVELKARQRLRAPALHRAASNAGRARDSATPKLADLPGPTNQLATLPHASKDQPSMAYGVSIEFANSEQNKNRATAAAEQHKQRLDAASARNKEPQDIVESTLQKRMGLTTQIPCRERREELWSKVKAMHIVPKLASKNAVRKGLTLEQVDIVVLEEYPDFSNKEAVVRAFRAADTNCSDHIELSQLKNLFHHLLFFKRRWPDFEKIAKSFTQGPQQLMSYKLFDLGCKELGLKLSAGDTKAAHRELRDGGNVNFESFCSWTARRAASQAPTGFSPPTMSTAKRPSCVITGHSKGQERQSLPTKPLDKMTRKDVTCWLREAQLEDHVQQFEDQQIDGEALVVLHEHLNNSDPAVHALWRERTQRELKLPRLGDFLVFWHALDRAANIAILSNAERDPVQFQPPPQ